MIAIWALELDYHWIIKVLQLQAYCQSHTSQRFGKELAKPTQYKIVLKNSRSFKKVKNAKCNTQPTWQWNKNSILTMVCKDWQTEHQPVTRYCQKRGWTASIGHLCKVQLSFFDYAFVLKLPAFGNTQNVLGKQKKKTIETKNEE